MYDRKDEIIDEQREKIRELEKAMESILEKVTEKPKRIANVLAGPYEENNTTHYTIELGGTRAVVAITDELLFGKKSTVEVGTSVLMMGETIIGVLPDVLDKSEKVKVDLTSWDEIGGLDSQINNIRDLIELPMANAKIAKEFGVSPSKGLLLYGPPGCGKTLVAKAIASTILKSNEVDPRAFAYVKGGELLSMYVGATEQKIGNLFKSAREYIAETGKQAVIFIDEAEAIMPRRGSRRSSDVDKTIVPTFLSEMDGLDGENSPFILLATNLADSLDDAITREGRIDVKIPINRPTEEDAKDIFKIHLKSVKCHDEISSIIDKAVTAIYNSPLKERVSGSLIKTVVNESARSAMKRKIQEPKTKEFGVTVSDIDHSLKLMNHA